jgi:hypothetical protein
MVNYGVLIILNKYTFPLHRLDLWYQGLNMPEYRLLYQQHIAARFLDLLHDVQDVRPLFLQHTVHSCIV